MNPELKITARMEALNATLDTDICCETDCGVTILVDKNDKKQGRQQRCTACLMRLKMCQSINQ